jgi:hypothetical protein
VLKHCATNRKRWLSALPNIIPYIYDVKISGFTRSFTYTVYDISRLRVNAMSIPLTTAVLERILEAAILCCRSA